MQTIQIIISGKVQGVWFRKSTKEKADDLGILGNVQNLPNEKVKVIAKGSEKQLEELKAWAKLGPKFAEVQSIEVTSIHEPLQFEDFEIIR